MKAKTLILVLLIAGVAGWYLSENLEEKFSLSEPAEVETRVELSPTQPQAASERQPVPARHPLEALPATPTVQEVVEPAFPESLAQADAYLRERLGQLIPDKPTLNLLNLNFFIQKFVLFVDHLPTKNIPRLHLPLLPPEPGFVTVGTGETLVIGQKNARRYRGYVSLVEAIPDAGLIRLYRGLYPLFQEAYRQSGIENGHFNDRLIEAFDDLLQTPEPAAPLTVVAHVSRYRFANPALEELSAGQKILLRMGLENTRRVKMKIQGLRQALARQDW
jgi:hypothetical protein